MHIILVLAKGKFETHEFVTIREACGIAHRHRRTIDRWIKEGVLLPCYVGDERCIREDQLREVMVQRAKRLFPPATTSSTTGKFLLTTVKNTATTSPTFSPISEYQYVPDAGQVKQ